MTPSLWHSVHERFTGGDVPAAVEFLEQFITSREAQRFSCLPGTSFSNSKALVISEINRFVEATNAQFDVKAVYLEMNGFDINYDRWYFDFFGYTDYEPGAEETDWLCEWQSKEWPQFKLSGMEHAQEAFAWYHGEKIYRSQPELEPVYEASMLLVMTKFAAFIGSSLKSGALVRPIPIFATAHDFDSIAKYGP
jgi:hypothetical protein